MPLPPVESHQSPAPRSAQTGILPTAAREISGRPPLRPYYGKFGDLAASKGAALRRGFRPAVPLGARAPTAWLGSHCGSSVSQSRIPCKQGILQGNHAHKARQALSKSAFRQKLQRLGPNFPKKRNREFWLTEPGIRNSEQRIATHDADSCSSVSASRYDAVWKNRSIVRPPAPPAPIRSSAHTPVQQ